MATETENKELPAEKRAQLVAMMKEAAGAVVAEVVEERMAKEAEARKSGIDGVKALLARRDAAEKSRDEKPGMALARAALASAQVRLDPEKGSAVSRAAKLYGEDSAPVKILRGDFQKAMGADDFDAGGSLVEEGMAAGIIPALAPMTVVRSLNPQVLPNPTGTLDIRQITGNPSFGWGGEGQNFSKSEATTGLVKVTAKRNGGVVPMSNDLIRYGGPEVEEAIRQSILTGLAVAEDSAFIRGDGTGGAPKGVRNWAPASNVFDSSAGHAPGSVTLAAVTNDLGRAIRVLLDANVNPDTMGGAWIFAPRTWQYLFTIRDGNGNLVFMPEMASGTLFGFPFRRTTQIPTNLNASASGGNDESEVVFAAMRHIRVYDSPGAEVRAFDGGAYHDGANVQSGISLDETAIRAQIRTDLVAEHGEAVAVIEEVVWGEPS